MQEYSKRIGKISDEQFQKALDKFNLGKFVKASKIPFGNFGQNVFVTSDKGEFVLRGCPHDYTQFEREKFLAELFHKKTKVPVPYPYFHDGSHDIFGWKFVIMPKMPGVQLADSKIYKNLSKEDNIGISVAMAKNLSDMQKLTWSHAGEYGYFSQTVNPFGKDFFSLVKDRIIGFVDKSMTYNNSTTKIDKAWIEGLLTKGKSAIESEFVPTIVIQDYKLGNAVAEKASNGWKISGIFDFQEWYFGDGEIDLYRTALCYVDDGDKECLSVYVSNYLKQRQIRPGFKERLPVYILLDRMIIWEWAQRTKRVWWDKALTLKQWSEPYINKILEVIEGEK